jgi:uncharacterized SAM-binding protein YcdF (DUF218 family)
MTVEFPHVTDAAAGNCRQAKRSLRRRLVGLVCAIPVFAIVTLLAGFLYFAFHVANRETPLDRMADGIVALTGGASRINDAVELLALGRGQRLLITGVSPTTNTAELARLVPDHQEWFSCCIDLDYSAINTIGNAVETRRWALKRGFRSLVVVTSSYHMPRAMLEIGHRLPGVILIPFPVVTEQSRQEPWWSNLGSARILVFEYLKYIVAAARIGFDQEPATTEIAHRGRVKI